MIWLYVKSAISLGSIFNEAYSWLFMSQASKKQWYSFSRTTIPRYGVGLVRVKVVRVVIGESDEGQNQNKNKNKKLAHVYMTSAALNYSPNAKNLIRLTFKSLGVLTFKLKSWNPGLTGTSCLFFYHEYP